MNSRKSLYRNELGLIAGGEMAVFGILIFVMGTLLVVNLWAVIDTKLAVDAAAREAARTYAESTDAAQAPIDANSAAKQTLIGYNRNAALANVQITTTAGFTRCSSFTIVVQYPTPIFSLPLLGQIAGTSTVAGEHTEIIDPYRTGLTNDANC